MIKLNFVLLAQRARSLAPSQNNNKLPVPRGIDATEPSSDENIPPSKPIENLKKQDKLPPCK